MTTSVIEARSVIFPVHLPDIAASFTLVTVSTSAQFSLIHTAALSSPMRSDTLSISSLTHDGATSTIPRSRRL